MPYSEARAKVAIDFTEKLLTHTKGEWAGKPFILADWQREDIFKPLFGTLNADGTRQYRTAYIEIPRKNGKSELAAAIALVLLYADGEGGCEIYSAAGDRDQASIVFNVALTMVQGSPSLLKRSKLLESTKRIVNRGTNSFYRAISAEAFSKHGFNAHGIIFDELHVQPNRELWDVLTSSTGARRQPLTVAITTAGFDINSICYEQHDYALKVINGVVKDPTFFAYVRSAPREADWTDEKVWYECNPALGSGFRNIEEMRTFAAQAKETPGKENAFRRLYLNQWTSQETRWLSLTSWDACSEPVDPEELKGKACYAGLDLASTTDIAALLLAFEDEEKGYDILPFFWIPGDNIRERVNRDRVPYDVWLRQGYIKATPGNVIDYRYIRQEIEALAEIYNIREIAYDRWGATQLVQELQDAGLEVIPCGQGYTSMSPPTKELLNLVLAKRMRHGGNPVLRWMVDNLVVKQDPAGNVKPDKEKSREKIDGVVALIMAIDRATRHENEGSIYDKEGIFFV